MKRDNIFWGVALVLFGFLFLLQKQGIIHNVFTYFWPLILMFVGGWLIVGVYWKTAPDSSETFAVNLHEAKSIEYRFSHGAAQVQIRGGAPAGKAIVGSSAAAMSHHDQLDGDKLDVRVDTGPSLIPFIGPSGGVWQYQIANDVPGSLSIDAGASTFDIDLKDTLVAQITIKIGASNVDLIMPARGASFLNIDAGAASFNIRVPETTAARIDARDGFSALDVDTNRFVQIEPGIYQSPNFDQAPDRAVINIKAGMASLKVK